jgi:hypothetical protein
MLERIVAGIALAMVKWLEGRIEKRPRAVDSDLDRDALKRAGSRVREWMREDGSNQRGKSDSDRP